MNFEDTITRAIQCWPLLYQERNSVINHLFFVIGNGYEWQKGELISLEDEARPEEMGLGLAKRIACEARPLTYHYSLCEYSKIWNLPDNITTSWAAGALEALDLLEVTPCMMDM